MVVLAEVATLRFHQLPQNKNAGAGKGNAFNSFASRARHSAILSEWVASCRCRRPAQISEISFFPRSSPSHRDEW